MKKALTMLPVNLPAAYDDAFARIRAKGGESYDLALRILSWIYYATVPLRMRQLREALTIDDEDHLEEEDLLPADRIIEICGSLVVHDKSSGIVRFTHYTVQEFLRSSLSQQLTSIVELGKTCLNCLNFKEFEAGPCPDTDSLRQRLCKPQFCGYAARMWGEYIRGKGEENDEIVRGVLRLLKCEQKRNSMLQLEHAADINNPFGFYTKDQTPLHVLAKMGLAIICHRLLEDQQMFSTQTATGISITATRIGCRGEAASERADEEITSA